MYKKCYDTCETCEIKGNNESHKCLKCDVEFSFEIQVNNYINCYKKCPQNNYYFDDNNVYHCNESLSFNSEYPQITNEEIEFITRDIKYIQNVIDSLLYFGKNETKNEIENDDEINNYKRILEEVESIFISDNFELTKIDEVKEQELKANKLIISFSNYENQKNNKYNNISTIDLDNCENLIRIHYNLTNNETIYMIKININQDKMKTKKSLFNIYSKISDKKLEKLNISLCENSKIFIYVPIEINDNIDKLNISSGYFNDICYSATSSYGTDISLNDRKNEYIYGDNIVCQEDCDFSDYDHKLKKAKCDCKIKESNLFSLFEDININKTKIIENLKDIKNLMNLNILICYKKLLSFISFINIIHNIGCLIISCIIIFYIISIFIFYIIQFNKIIKIIKDISFGIKNINLLKKEKSNKILKQKIVNKKKKKKIIKE